MNDAQTNDRSSSYTRMDHGTAEQYAAASAMNKTFFEGYPDWVLAQLRQLEFSFPGGGQVHRLEHSLQTATRAFNAGECEEFVVAALLHDISDLISPHNHADIAADVVRPYVSQYTFGWLNIRDFSGLLFLGQGR